MSLLGNFSVATCANNVFNGTVLNDVLLTSQSNQNIWIGGATGASNVLCVGSNLVSCSNLNVSGLMSVSNLTVSGTVTGFNGVSSNQSFSNVYSSNIYGSNVYGSNATFSNLTVGIGGENDTGKLSCVGLSNAGGFSNAGVAVIGGNLGVGTNSPAYPLDVVGNINCSGSISAGTINTAIACKIGSYGSSFKSVIAFKTVIGSSANASYTNGAYGYGGTAEGSIYGFTIPFPSTYANVQNLIITCTIQDQNGAFIFNHKLNWVTTSTANVDIYRVDYPGRTWSSTTTTVHMVVYEI